MCGNRKIMLTLCGLLSLTLVMMTRAEPVPKDLLGDWSLEMESGLPAWLSIAETNGQPLVFMRLYVGSDGPHHDAKIENGRLKFEIRKNNKKKKTATVQKVDIGLIEGKLDGLISRQTKDQEKFTGKRIPPMPISAPDLSTVRFGKPVSLFNGQDLTGWRAYEPDKAFGWGVKDGMLVNTTPKTDFSATGAFANLRTEAEFEDFRLHIEFLIGTNRNSGVYLRGMYEAQVVDRDSRMQGLQGVGAIFSRIAPSENAGKPGGEWQTYDITLVDRHVTVVLNGIRVIDNQPVIGPTGGAIYTDPSAPGPIYLQGDHTSVTYRNIYLVPVIKTDSKAAGCGD